jgi:hypothetical protein
LKEGTSCYDPIYYDRTLSGRLNAPDASYGVLYAAKTPHGAFAESFLRTPGRRSLDAKLLAKKAYVELKVARPLRLINFDGPNLAILGATAEIVHGGPPYDNAHAWSVALRAHPIAADGIAYTARHDPAQLCYALFDDGAAKVTEDRRVEDLDATWFWEIAETYDAGFAS